MPNDSNPSPNAAATQRHSMSYGIVGRIYKNLGKLLGGKAIAGVVSLAYMIIAVRALGAHDYGVLILLHTYVITVGGVIEFPGWQGVVRYGAMAREAGDTPRLIRLLRLSMIVEVTGGVVAIVVAAALAPWIGRHLGWSAPAVAFAVPYSLAVMATIRSTPAGYLQLRGRFDLLGLHNVVSPIIRLIGALVAVATGAGLLGFLLAWLAAALAECFSMWALGLWIIRRELIGHRLAGSPRGSIAENPGIRRFMLAANADVTFGDLSQRLTSLIIGWVMGPIATGIFAVAQRATAVIAQPAGNLGQAAYAEIARLLAAGGRGSEIRRLLVKSLSIALAAVIPLVILVAVFGPTIARMIGGPRFGPAGSVMLWLFVARAILLVGPPASAALVAMGMPGSSFLANLICSLGLLPFLPLALLAFGLPGAGAFALLQATCTAVLLGGVLWRRTSP